jgi:hypothetical protein
MTFEGGRPSQQVEFVVVYFCAVITFFIVITQICGTFFLKKK